MTNPPPPGLSRWVSGLDITPLGRDQAQVWIVELDDGMDQESAASFNPSAPEFAPLSPDEVARASRFIRPRDRLRFARCRVALRQILASLLALSPDQLTFRTQGAGKPELDPQSTARSPHHPSALRFNVSHSAHLGLIAACHGRELGVDIERIRSIKEADRIVASYFTPAEQATFAKVPAHLKDLAFHRGWTRKEAIIKAEGTGLAGLAHSFETHFGEAEPTGAFRPSQPFSRINRWLLWEAAPAPGFVAALALDSTLLPT